MTPATQPSRYVLGNTTGIFSSSASRYGTGTVALITTVPLLAGSGRPTYISLRRKKISSPQLSGSKSGPDSYLSMRASPQVRPSSADNW